LRILVAHFDDLRAGALKHALSFVDLLGEATALPDCSNHRLLMISPYRYSSARIRAGKSNGFPRRKPITLTFNPMKAWMAPGRPAAIIRAGGPRRLSPLRGASSL